MLSAISTESLIVSNRTSSGWRSDTAPGLIRYARARREPTETYSQPPKYTYAHKLTLSPLIHSFTHSFTHSLTPPAPLQFTIDDDHANAGWTSLVNHESIQKEETKQRRHSTMYDENVHAGTDRTHTATRTHSTARGNCTGTAFARFVCQTLHACAAGPD